MHLIKIVQVFSSLTICKDFFMNQRTHGPCTMTEHLYYSEPLYQWQLEERPTVCSLWTCRACSTSLCALVRQSTKYMCALVVRQKVLRVRQYVRTFGPERLSQCPTSCLLNLRVMPCQLFGYINTTHILDTSSTQPKGMTLPVFWWNLSFCPLSYCLLSSWGHIVIYFQHFDALTFVKKI